MATFLILWERDKNAKKTVLCPFLGYVVSSLAGTDLNPSNDIFVITECMY